MIYFDIELKYHDFSKAKYMRRTYNRKSTIVRNTKPNIAFAIDGLHPSPPDQELLKLVLTGQFYIIEPYPENK